MRERAVESDGISNKHTDMCIIWLAVHLNGMNLPFFLAGTNCKICSNRIS